MGTLVQAIVARSKSSKTQRVTNFSTLVISELAHKINRADLEIQGVQLNNSQAKVDAEESLAEAREAAASAIYSLPKEVLNSTESMKGHTKKYLKGITNAGNLVSSLELALEKLVESQEKQIAKMTAAKQELADVKALLEGDHDVVTSESDSDQE